MKNKQPKELVRSDLNLERWEIFTTRSYPYKSRELIRKENGKEIKVIIGKRPNGEEIGVLNALDGKIFYTLLKWWEEQGRPDNGYVIFKTRELLQKLGKKTDSKHDYQRIEIHLDRLRTIPIRWIESYEREGVREIAGFGLLYHYRLFERKKDDSNKPYFGFSEVIINNEIIKSIKSKNIKPVRLDVIRQLKSDFAFILYRWLDITLYAVPVGGVFQRDLREIAKICGIEKQPLFKIKWKIKRAIKELEGKELTSGVLRNLRIEESDTESSWKLVVEKGPFARKEIPEKTKIIDLELPEMPQVSLEDQQARELVLYFHECLGHKDPEGKTVSPNTLELSQAAKLIKEYGFEWTKELVDYVIDWLNDRGMSANVFGYVLTCLNSFKEMKDEIKREEERRKREKEEQQYRESQLSKLPEMIYQKLYEEIKSRLLLKYKDDTYILASLEGRTYPDAGRKVVEEEMIKVIKNFPVVTLKYVDFQAQDVKVAGDWNSWNPEPMEKKENGIWFKEIRLPAGIYKYKFVVDGVWISDPHSEKASDEFGNSVLRLLL